MEVGTSPTLRSRHLGGPASHLSFNPRPQAGGELVAFAPEPSRLRATYCPAKLRTDLSAKLRTPAATDCTEFTADSPAFVPTACAVLPNSAKERSAALFSE